jgi:RimJ/RimL family protein N-acetyltransferase
MTPLHTERLTLRPATLEDAPCYALAVGDYDVARYLTPVPYPFSLAMARDWLLKTPPPTPQQALLIVELPGKGLIGCVMIGEEFGFWIARPHWGRGYATEAARGLLDYHFAGSDSAAVVASAHHNNAASLAVQKKLGFVAAGRDMRFSQTLQRNVEHVVSRLHRRDWQCMRTVA